MNNQATLSIYAEIVDITNQMLIASKAQDWDSLEKLESTCAQHVEKMRTLSSTEPLTEAERSMRIGYIEKILATDREIRNEVEPWMAKLSSMMNTTGNQHKLAQAYGGNTRH